MAMNLGDRLRQVVTGTRPATSDLEHDQRRYAPPRPRIEGWRIADVLAGQWIDSPEGAVVVVDRYYAADRRHGRTPIGELVELLDGGQAELDVLARAWPWRRRNATRDEGGETRYGSRLCFLDLETTGLAGGAGTQAFLVGCAIVEDGGPQVIHRAGPADVMLAEECLDGEDAHAAVGARAGHPADVGERAGALVDGSRDGGVVDDPALADDHHTAPFAPSATGSRARH